MHAAKPQRCFTAATCTTRRAEAIAARLTNTLSYKSCLTKSGRGIKTGTADTRGLSAANFAKAMARRWLISNWFKRNRNLTAPRSAIARDSSRAQFPQREGKPVPREPSTVARARRSRIAEGSPRPAFSPDFLGLTQKRLPVGAVSNRA